MDRIKRIFSLKSILLVLSFASSIALILAYLSSFIHPESASLLPFFGLTYPIIILCQFVLIATWAFIQWKWSLFFFLIVLFGGNLHFRPFAVGSENTPPKGAPSIKVLSYNVHLLDRYNPDLKASVARKNKIIAYLNKEQPDIACFQEFYHQDYPTSFVTKDTIVKLLKTKDYHESYIHKKYGRQNFGIIILSKYPVIEKGGIPIPGDPQNLNHSIYVDIVTEWDTIRVYNVHVQSIKLSPNDYAVFDDKSEDKSAGVWSVFEKVKRAYPIRADQAETLVKHIQNSPHPVVLCGDFNDTPLSYTYNQLNSVLIDAFRNTSFGIGKTYAEKIPAGRIDYIFHSESLNSYNFRIQEEKLSDHFAISCRIYANEE